MAEQKKLDKIMAKAKDVVSENEKVKNLLSDVRSKLEKIADDSDERSNFVKQISVMLRMIRAHFNGSYAAFSISTVLSIVFALVYFITPIDLIPDFIPALGLTDDVSIVYFIFRSLTDDIARFKTWEESSS